MDVTLRPELQKLIEDEIKSGRSADPNDFLNRAVYHYVRPTRPSPGSILCPSPSGDRAIR